MKRRFLFPFLFMPLLGIFSFNSCSRHTDSSDDRMNEFIDSLMAQMKIEEKLGQLNLPVAGDIVTGEAQSGSVAESIRAGRVGGLFSLKGVDVIRQMQRIAVEESRLHIPLIFGMDVIHGFETVFPIPLAIGCTWDVNTTEELSRISAMEATADGICWTFSPMVDVCHDARWGRIAEGFGEDPYLVSRMGEAMVKGYQQNDLTDDHTMMACVKHFALYGAPEGGRDYNTVDMSRYRMYNDYLPPYLAAVTAGVGSVMASFNTIDAVPATCNKWLLTDLLRDQWQFKGFVVSDYTGIAELIQHGVAENLEEASKQALAAGLDMDMVSEGLVNLKNTDVNLINTACRRILEAKWKLGLFEDPYRYCKDDRREKEILTPDSRTFARQVARESFVLLKNTNDLLPLKRNQTLALIGPLADTRANMSGTWAVAAVSEKYKTLKEGLEEAVKGKGKLLYAKGCNLMYDAGKEADATMFGREMRDSRSNKVMQTEALEKAKLADVVVVAMGEVSEMSGESASRADLRMPDAQHDLLVELLKLNKPIVLLHFSGRPVVLNWENEHIDAILQVWFGGSETADAVADVLFGDYSPSGRLCVSFPRSVGQLPMSYRHYNTGRPIDADDRFYKFRSNYMDERNSPLFPFGYGLSYTQFEYATPSLSKTDLILSENDSVSLEVTVRNVGHYNSDEVVQLYICDEVCRPVRPTCELRDFQRLSIKAGEAVGVRFTIDARTLGFYDGNLQWTTPKGRYKIMVGHDCVSLDTVYLTVK